MIRLSSPSVVRFFRRWLLGLVSICSLVTSGCVTEDNLRKERTGTELSSASVPKSKRGEASNQSFEQLENNKSAFSDDGMRAFVRQARPPKGDIEFKTISSEANEIEADLGAK
jgi:hypothetical protein